MNYSNIINYSSKSIPCIDPWICGITVILTAIWWHSHCMSQSSLVCRATGMLCCWRNVTGFFQFTWEIKSLQTVDGANITASFKLKALAALRTVLGITVTQKQTFHTSFLAALRNNTKLTENERLLRPVIHNSCQ